MMRVLRRTDSFCSSSVRKVPFQFRRAFPDTLKTVGVLKSSGRPSLGSDGRPLDFNTPTVFNVSGNARLNWKGTFRTLEEQNESVLRNTRIMNANWDELLAKLRNDSDYRK